MILKGKVFIPRLKDHLSREIIIMQLWPCDYWASCIFLFHLEYDLERVKFWSFSLSGEYEVFFKRKKFLGQLFLSREIQNFFQSQILTNILRRELEIFCRYSNWTSLYKLIRETFGKKKFKILDNDEIISFRFFPILVTFLLLKRKVTENVLIFYSTRVPNKESQRAIRKLENQIQWDQVQK